MSGVVTEARFDTSEAVPVLKFRAVRPLTREELAVARGQGSSEDALQAVEFKMVAKEVAPMPALPASFAKPAEPAAPEVKAEEVAPVKRASKKAEVVAAPTKDVAAMMDEWGSDDE